MIKNDDNNQKSLKRNQQIKICNYLVFIIKEKAKKEVEDVSLNHGFLHAHEVDTIFYINNV
jgi:hypothetical protein